MWNWNRGFNLVLFNDYRTRYTEIRTIYIEDTSNIEKGFCGKTFNTVQEMINELMKYTDKFSSENGTLQVLEWILGG